MDSKAITLKNIYTLLFLMGVFFIPFNDFQGFSFLGEYQNEAATYFFLGGFAMVLIEAILRRKIFLPIKSIYVQLIVLFIVWTIITFVFNFESISENYFKQTSGTSRFIRQFISLIISSVVFSVLFWSVIRKRSIIELFEKIRRVILGCLIFVFIYGCLEVLIVRFGVYQVFNIYKAFEIFPFVKTHLHIEGRISSVSYEVPALGNYLITIAPWMFSYFLTTKKRLLQLAPTAMIILLTLLSGSRTALINVTLQLLIFIGFLMTQKRYRDYFIMISKYIIPLLLVFVLLNKNSIMNAVQDKMDSLNFSKNLTNSISNKTRFGMQYASLRVFEEHPIIGVGLGQETYHKRKHYPSWATDNNFEFTSMFENEEVKSFPSAYNIFTRLLAETGIVGFLLFLSLVFLAIYGAYFYTIRSQGEFQIIALVLFISLVGLSINWLQTDFFRQYGFWLCLMLLIRLKEVCVPNDTGKLE